MIKLMLCSIDSNPILKKVPNSSKPMKSKPLLTQPPIKLNPKLKLLDFTWTPKRDTLILKNSPSISKSLSSLKLMPGNSPDNLTKMLLMLRMISPTKKLSSTKKLTEEMVNSPILNGLLISSKNKLPLSVTPSEVELMTTSTMKDSIACSQEKPMIMSKQVLMVLSATDRLKIK